MTLPIGKKVELEIGGQTYQVEIKSLSANQAQVEVDGKKYNVNIRVPRDSQRTSAPKPIARPKPTPAKPAAPRPASAGAESLRSLMPGMVIKILVKAGQQVATGDVLLVLEAMKMENDIRSDRSGTIGSIDVSSGQQVQTGDSLVSFD